MNNIEFKFKNNRDYLHGTDIFNYLVKKKKIYINRYKI